MKIKVLGFATAAAALGGGEVEVELEEGARVADLGRRLRADHPELEPLWPRLAVAVDGELTTEDGRLSDGAEVALLPPVSGGSGPAVAAPEALSPGVAATALTDEPISVERVLTAVSHPAAGAVVLFLGTVRDHHRGRAVTRLVYSSYRPMAEAALARIVGELEAGSAGLRAAIVHRLGTVPLGEPSVAIAVSSPHRAEAYQASRTALERLKREVPIWKRETYADGSTAWREEEPLAALTPARPDRP